MVSLIGWIVNTGSYEDFVSTTTDETGFLEASCVDSSIREHDVMQEVIIVLVSLE